MKILCICPIGIGNYILCYPAFHRIKQARPDAKLYLLALRSGIAQLAANDTLWDGIESFDPHELKGKLFKKIGYIARLRKLRFDASISFFPSNTWQYSLLPFLAAVRKRYAFKYHKYGFRTLSFLNNKKIKVDPELHDVQQNYALIGTFLKQAVQPDGHVFPVLFSPADHQWSGYYYQSASPHQIRIAVHPGSSTERGMDAKRWEPKRFAQLADRLCYHLNADAFIFGGPDEEGLKQEVAHHMRMSSHVVVPMPLNRTAAMLSMCTLCLCNDSGLMHIAASEGVPTVALFGPTDEKRNGPVGDKTLVIRKPMKGFPLWTAGNVGKRTMKRGIDPHASLEALTSDDAWEQLVPWLKATFPDIKPAPHV
jgi:heptosyltransferase II